VVGDSSVDRLGGDKEPQVDRCDEGPDELSRVGVGRQLAAGDGAGDDGLCSPETVGEEAALHVRDLRYPAGVGQRRGGDGLPGRAVEEPDERPRQLAEVRVDVAGAAWVPQLIGFLVYVPG